MQYAPYVIAAYMPTKLHWTKTETSAFIINEMITKLRHYDVCCDIYYFDADFHDYYLILFVCV
jgi:hypothetical protein